MNYEFWEKKYDLLIKRGQLGSMSLKADDRHYEFFTGLLKELKKYKGKVIVDFGCGSAKNYQFLMSIFKGDCYIGYDISHNILKYCKSLNLKDAEFKFYKQEIEEPFDIAWASFVLQHADDTDFLDILAQLKSQSSSQSRILIINSVISGQNTDNMYFRSVEEHEKLFKKAGLKHKKIAEVDVSGTRCALWELKK